MALQAADIYSKQAVSKRLHILRHAVVGSDRGAQSRFAARVGIERPAWSNYERGWPLPRDAAIQLVRHALAEGGLKLDWIYFGNTDGMSAVLIEKFIDAARELAVVDGSYLDFVSGSFAVETKVRHYSGSGRKKPRTKSRA